MIRIRGAIILTVGVLAGGCGEIPDPPWVLGDDPLVLALRTEVTVAATPFFGILPADRWRAEPLPGDTIRIKPLVADGNGVVDLASLQPHWLLCPSDEIACVSTLDQPGALRPCTGWPEEMVACSLGVAPELELTIPDLDPERELTEQVGLQIAFVAGDPAIASTADCIEALEHEKTGNLRGCMLAYTFVRVGPLAPLAALAQQAGIDLGVELPEGIPLDGIAQQPNFNPEIEQLVLYGGGREFVVYPDEVTELPRGVLFGWESPGDPGDWQKYGELSESGIIPLQESIESAVFFTAPDLRETFRPTFDTGTSVDAFTLFVVVSDRRGGQGWGQFDFVVSESVP